jgi:hypothetical protein
VETVYDWVTVAVFAGLIVLFLQRSSGEGEPQDSIWQYLLASVGCAVANYLGNHEMQIPAIAVLVATVGFIWFALKPFQRSG